MGQVLTNYNAFFIINITEILIWIGFSANLNSVSSLSVEDLQQLGWPISQAVLVAATKAIFIRSILVEQCDQIWRNITTKA